MKKRFSLPAVIAVLIFIFSLPLWMRNVYYMHVLNIIVLNIILSISFYLILYFGRLNFGHAAFMAIGAYSTTTLVMRTGLSFWFALPIGGLIGALISVVIGWPVLRLRGLYFAIVTFAFSILVMTFFNHAAVSVFGGPHGIMGIPPPSSIFGVDFSTRFGFFWILYFIALIAFIVIWRIMHIPLGRNLSILNEREELAASIGVNAAQCKALGFAIGSFFASIAGGLYAFYFWYITPECFSLTTTMNVAIYVIVGGAGNLLGPLIGTIAMGLLHESLRSMGTYIPIFFGLILVGIIIFLPGGIVSIPRRLRGFIKRKAPLPKGLN